MKYLQATFLAWMALLAFSGVHSSSLQCPSLCPAVFQPTCATDGEKYFNFDSPCKLRAFNCQRQRSALSAYTTTDLDWCTTVNYDELETPLVPNLNEVDSSCHNACPRIYKPVCGSNGTLRKSFNNECLMNSYSCIFKTLKKEGFKLLRRGRC